MPEVLRGERAAFVIVTTDQGNIAKLLLSTGMRQRSGEAGKDNLVPVMVVDRFETIDAGDRMSFKARGRDLMMFEGFQVDLDSGQVVPEGFGGDIRLVAGGAGGPDLQALGKNRLYTFEKALPIALTAPGRPSSGRAVLPSDFNGRYSLMANGQISGMLDLAVDPEGMVTGRFRSDRNGAVYTVAGKVAADLPRKIEFTIQFPRSRQEYEGLLWTEEKNAFAGTVQILDHPYSFFAIREGASLPSDSLELQEKPIVKGTTRHVVILEDQADRYTIDGVTRTAAELTTALAESAKIQPAETVVLRVPDSASFDRVHRAAQLIRSAGVTSIRLAPKSE
ncbi:MAG: ExbD/TolR family protein [Isosphaeraceae bacterium]